MTTMFIHEETSQAVLVDTSRGEHYYHLLKRTIDVVFSFSVLLVLLPVLLFIAFLVKIDSPGPALFIQERVGARRRVKNGYTFWEVQNFRVCKFRTMTHNADESLHQEHIRAYVAGEEGVVATDENTFKVKNDPRITRIGRFLRKTSLDELPQFINVLRGEMSVVGPRPVPTYEVDEYKPWHYERLSALPGITGMWQVKGRCSVSFDEQIRLDIDYVRSRSVILDVKLILLTIPAVLTGKGAS